MKVVLTKDVKNMGRAGSIIDATDGHALNFLIPRKMAVLATGANLAQAEARKTKTDASHAASAAATAESFAKLGTQTITITAKANEQGHLYTGIAATDIAAAIEAQAHLTLSPEAIDLDKPIKETGEYDVKMSDGEQKGTLKLVIEAGA